MTLAQEPRNLPQRKFPKNARKLKIGKGCLSFSVRESLSTGVPNKTPWDSLANHTSIRDGLFGNATVGGLLTANLRKASFLTDALVNSKDLQDLAGAQYFGNPKFINLPLEIEGYESGL